MFLREGMVEIKYLAARLIVTKAVMAHSPVSATAWVGSLSHR